MTSSQINAHDSDTDSLLTSRNSLIRHSYSSQLSDASLSTSTVNWSTFTLGARFGCLLLLLTWVMWDCIVDARLRPSHQPAWITSVLPVYRAVFVLLLLGWGWGLQMTIWERWGIDYRRLLDLQMVNLDSPCAAYSTLTDSQLFDQLITVTCVSLVNFLLYFKILRGDFPAWLPSGYFPVMLCLYILYQILPFQQMYDAVLKSSPSTSGSYSILWSQLLQVLIAPFGRVSLLTTYLGDVLTSLVRPLVDWAYTLCFVFSMEWMYSDATIKQSTNSNTCQQSVYFKRVVVPLLSCLPLWFRFMQCMRKYVNTRQRFPNLYNGAKYALAHSVVLFGVFHAAFTDRSRQRWIDSDGDGDVDLDDEWMRFCKQLWVMSLVISTLYTFIWDVKMDWNLGQVKYGFLRQHLIFNSHRWIYYSAIFIDLFARFSWTLTLLPRDDDSQLIDSNFILYLQPFLACAEIARRSMWAVLRVENEQLTQIGQVSQISTPKTSRKRTNREDDEKTGKTVILEVTAIIFIVLTLAAFAILTAN